MLLMLLLLLTVLLPLLIVLTVDGSFFWAQFPVLARPLHLLTISLQRAAVIGLPFKRWSILSARLYSVSMLV